MTEFNNFELPNSWIHLDERKFRVLLQPRQARGLIRDIREGRVGASGAAAGHIRLDLLTLDGQGNSV